MNKLIMLLIALPLILIVLTQNGYRIVRENQNISDDANLSFIPASVKADNKNLECINFTTVKVLDRQIQFINLSVILNISERQRKEIMNARIPCNNIGCGEGAVRMKYEIMDVLELPHSKFSERPSYGYMDLDNNTYLKVYSDGWSQYINFSKDWYVASGDKTYNLSLLCHGNTSWITRTKINMKYQNKSFTLDNLSFANDTLWMPAQWGSAAQGGQLVIRHV